MSGDSSLPIGHGATITLVNGAVRTGVIFTYTPENSALVLLTPSANTTSSGKEINNNNKESNNNNSNNNNNHSWGFTVLNTAFIKSITRSTVPLTLPPSLAPGAQLPDLPTDDKLLTGKMKENIDKAIERRSKPMPPRDTNNSDDNNNNNNNNNKNTPLTMPVLALALYLQLSRTLPLSRWDNAEQCILVSSTPSSSVFHEHDWKPTHAPKLVWRGTPDETIAARQKHMLEQAWAKVTAQCEAYSQSATTGKESNKKDNK